MITAIILAGGNSLRFGGEIPKQFTQIAGRSLLDFSVSTFNATPSIDKIIIVVPIKFKNEIKDIHDLEGVSGHKSYHPNLTDHKDYPVTKMESILDEGDLLDKFYKKFYS